MDAKFTWRLFGPAFRRRFRFPASVLLPLTTMSFDDPASQTQLSASLEKLRIERDGPLAIPEEPGEDTHDGRGEGSSQRHVDVLHRREGYGFRPLSGISTPMYTSKAASAIKAESPLPDANGLGWPGKFLLAAPDVRVEV